MAAKNALFEEVFKHAVEIANNYGYMVDCVRGELLCKKVSHLFAYSLDNTCTNYQAMSDKLDELYKVLPDSGCYGSSGTTTVVKDCTMSVTDLSILSCASITITEL